EAFTDSDRTRRTFVWAVGPESALRVPLSAGVSRMTLRVSPAPAATGPLRIEVGDEARGQVEVAAGWRSYEVPIVGRVRPGVTRAARLGAAGALARRGFPRLRGRGRRSQPRHLAHPRWRGPASPLRVGGPVSIATPGPVVA